MLIHIGIGHLGKINREMALLKKRGDGVVTRERHRERFLLLDFDLKSWLKVN